MAASRSILCVYQHLTVCAGTSFNSGKLRAELMKPSNASDASCFMHALCTMPLFVRMFTNRLGLGLRGDPFVLGATRQPSYLQIAKSQRSRSHVQSLAPTLAKPLQTRNGVQQLRDTGGPGIQLA
jgi:hypothetical protein